MHDGVRSVGQTQGPEHCRGAKRAVVLRDGHADLLEAEAYLT